MTEVGQMEKTCFMQDTKLCPGATVMNRKLHPLPKHTQAQESVICNNFIRVSYATSSEMETSFLLYQLTLLNILWV